MKVIRAVFLHAPTISGTVRSVSQPDWEMGVRPEGLLVTHAGGVTLVPWGCVKQVEMGDPPTASQGASQGRASGVPKLKGGGG